jgi:hypothetical protein
VSAQALAPGASRPAAASGRRRTPGAWTITAFFAVIYLIAAPPSPDLAAAAYRGELFSRVGFTLWDNSWFAGHHLPAYSLLAPALSALLGPQLLVALSMIAAAALFARLIDGRFGARAVTVAAVWFALGVSVELLSSRVPYDLGLAIGLGSLLLAQRGRWLLALVLAVLCALASPVAGAFLAVAYLAWAGAGSSRARAGACVLGALLPIALLALAFPEGGSQPFVPSAFFPTLAAVALIWLLIPSEQAILKLGTLLYAFVLIGAYLLPTAVGGNADRLGALLAGPLAACVLVGSERGRGRPRLLLVLAPVLVYWQANAAITDYIATASDPAVHASYYAPLLGELRTLDVGYSRRPARIEAVPLADHWEARFLAPRVMIARGWERQLDRRRDAVFYDPSTPLDADLSPPLTAARFHAWLTEQAVSYVALPDARLDYAAHTEARLIRSGRLGYLREVWRSRHWRLFAVRGPSPLAQAPATISNATTDSFTVSVPRAGSYSVRVHFTPYWALSGGAGCVARAPGDWTDVEARRAGRLRVVIRFSLARVLSRGPRCN